MLNTARSRDSRRQVQRRFPPGAFAVCQSSDRVVTVVGWYPGPGVYTGNLGGGGHRILEKVRSWYVVTLDNSRIVELNWKRMAGNWTLDEWNHGAHAGA